MFRNTSQNANLLVLEAILIPIGNRARFCFRLLLKTVLAAWNVEPKVNFAATVAQRKEKLPLTIKIHLPRNVPWRQVLKNLGWGNYTGNEDGQINARNFSTKLWFASRIILEQLKCLRLSQLLWERNSEIIPTRCNNCVYSSQWLYSTCFGWQFHPSSGVQCCIWPLR